MNSNLFSLKNLKSNHLLADISEHQTPLLAMGIILLCASLIIIGAFIYYLFQFKQRKSETSIRSSLMIYLMIAISLVVTILGITGIVMYTQKEVLNIENNLLGIMIGIYAAGFITLVGLMIFIWFGINKFAISLTDESILFIGEKIDYSKILKIIKDDSKNAVYINYVQGKRSYRRQKFSLNSAFGVWIVKYSELTGHKVEDGNEDEYFKALIKRK
ncbi:hypothetical protein ELUMI_v1c07530 [Williamsoniiplasma luminosum]|uniref:Uncharacterized protein n=1 Tax=Williamsoniiplasma luminosum TaxID=214888 RepID=A0A2K8NUF2_9MOLU|nr:hypothetical protein [Williamsoniiplasma luminosum]ATZ17475.1 hypothetical protein ELUMI_v1c07530 [Williamsoniiplasma luminosum]